MNTKPVMPNPTDATHLDQVRWRIVAERDARFDGAFVYAVQTTGVFCRPSCPSRRPKPKHVIYYDSVASARAAGYRPCKRCQPQRLAGPHPQLAAVFTACHYLDKAQDGPPTLDELATHTRLSPHHLQRLFKRLLGISPREYYDAKRMGRLKAHLKNGASVTMALYEAGYGSSSRLYEQANARLGMTPATYRRGGQDMTLYYTLVDSPLGRLLVARTEHGIAAVSLGQSDAMLEAELQRDYPAAQIVPAKDDLTEAVQTLLAYLQGTLPHPELSLDIRATAFQQRVWRALQKIPAGQTRSYGEIARAIGKPTATRAVAGACASNPVSLVIPCHRVVRSDGGLGGYRWGVERKQALLEKEQEQHHQDGAHKNSNRKTTPAK